MSKKKANTILDNYYSGGHFKSHLLKAVQSADISNLRKLNNSFPLLIEAQCVYVGIDYKDLLRYVKIDDIKKVL